jgi:DNA invertase Pin-like site-specific DNA recombinase
MAPNKKAPRAIVYTRISLDRTGESLSPDRQEYLCRQQAEAKGWRVVESVGDRDRSGWKRGVARPGFDRIEQAVRGGEVDVVLAYSLSRLGRRASSLLAFAELLQDHKVGLSLVDQGIDTTTPGGRMFFTILAGFAEMEAETTSERVKSAHSVAAQAGKMHSGGVRAFGYRRDGTIIESEAAIIREVANRLMAGESLRQVAINLNDRGVKTATGREWSGPTLRQMIGAPRLTALRAHGDDLHEGEWEPILERRAWTLLQAKLTKPAGARRSTAAHLLSGIARCGLCAGSLKTMGFRMKNGKPFERYACVKQPGQPNCGGVAVAKNSLDLFIRDQFLDFMAAAEVRPEVESVETATARVDEIKDRLAVLSADYYVNGTIGRDVFFAAKTPLDEQLAGAELALTTAVRERAEREGALLPGDRDGLAKWWERAPVPERRAALRRAIDHVSIQPAKVRGGNKFDTSRVLVEWSGRVYGLDRVVDAVNRVNQAERRPAVIRGER